MIALAHRVFPYVEGHKFYCEHWYTNLFFNKIREFSALLSEHGFFSKSRRIPSHTLRAGIGDRRSHDCLVQRLDAARTVHWPTLVAGDAPP
jgi:hypothetical protein